MLLDYCLTDMYVNDNILPFASFYNCSKEKLEKIMAAPCIYSGVRVDYVQYQYLNQEDV